MNRLTQCKPLSSSNLDHITISVEEINKLVDPSKMNMTCRIGNFSDVEQSAYILPVCRVKYDFPNHKSNFKSKLSVVMEQTANFATVLADRTGQSIDKITRKHEEYVLGCIQNMTDFENRIARDVFETVKSNVDFFHEGVDFEEWKNDHWVSTLVMMNGHTMSLPVNYSPNSMPGLQMPQGVKYSEQVKVYIQEACYSEKNEPINPGTLECFMANSFLVPIVYPVHVHSFSKGMADPKLKFAIKWVPSGFRLVISEPLRLDQMHIPELPDHFSSMYTEDE